MEQDNVSTTEKAGVAVLLWDKLVFKVKKLSEIKRSFQKDKGANLSRGCNPKLYITWHGSKMFKAKNHRITGERKKFTISVGDRSLSCPSPFWVLFPVDFQELWNEKDRNIHFRMYLLASSTKIVKERWMWGAKWDIAYLSFTNLLRQLFKN